MILITGGICSGKKTMAEKLLGKSREEFSSQEVAFLDRCIKNEPAASPEELSERLQSFRIVIAPETGCGIVPEDKKDREFREKLGRTSCLLGEKEDQVIKMVCGIPTFLKK